MLKKGVFLILLLILVPSVLAIETTLKQEYQLGETLIAEITGNFIDNLKPEDIVFYSGRAYIPMIYDLAKIKEKYYLYALLPHQQRDYTLTIKNAHYIESGQKKTQDLKYDFSVTGNESLFTVNPGFIITNKDFSIKVKSNIKTINLNSNFLSSTQNFSIPIGEKTISFSVSDISTQTITTLTLESGDKKYELPVAVIPTETPEIEVSEKLRFSKSFFNITVLQDKEFQFPLTILNTGQENLENISLSTDLEILNITQTLDIESGSSKDISVIVNSPQEGVIEGSITVTSEGISYGVLISITTTKNEQEFQEFIEETEIIEEESCEEMNGKVCEAEEECDGTTKLTAEGLCCTGNCKKESTWTLTKILALIFVILIIIIIIVIIMIKLKSKQKSHKEILESKSKQYEERFKPEPIKGGLSRV